MAAFLCFAHGLMFLCRGPGRSWELFPLWTWQYTRRRRAPFLNAAFVFCRYKYLVGFLLLSQWRLIPPGALSANHPFSPGLTMEGDRQGADATVPLLNLAALGNHHRRLLSNGIHGDHVMCTKRCGHDAGICNP